MLIAGEGRYGAALQATLESEYEDIPFPLKVSIKVNLSEHIRKELEDLGLNVLLASGCAPDCQVVGTALLCCVEGLSKLDYVESIDLVTMG